jgi:phosphatidylserine/phosphatidylglycerophosphate/cardiolipin synthase-like enzyme
MCYKNINNGEIFSELIKRGAEVYEYRHQFLHMKAYLTDGKVSIGSMNNDRWSWYVNNELNILVN